MLFETNRKNKCDQNKNEHIIDQFNQFIKYPGQNQLYTQIIEVKDIIGN